MEPLDEAATDRRTTEKNPDVGQLLRMMVMHSV